MNPVEFMACPECSGDLKQSPVNHDLFCEVCGKVIKFFDGIYYADTSPYSSEAKQTIAEFGKRWKKVYKKMGGLKDFLLPTIEPVKKEFFRGKCIIDGGGGFGRLTKIMLDYGARHVVLLEASDAVLAAKFYLENYRDKVTIIKGNLLKSPLTEGSFDLFFCHGVLHHTGDPRKVILSMSRTVNKQKGCMILWVYAQEGNRGLSRLVNLIRFFSLKIGDWGRWRLGALIDIVLWLLTKCVYIPLLLLAVPKQRLWYGTYFIDFLFNPEINNRVDRLQMYHDFMTTDIIEYYSKSQLEQWVKEADYKTATFYFYRNQSWSVAACYHPKEDFSGNQ